VLVSKAYGVQESADVVAEATLRAAAAPALPPRYSALPPLPPNPHGLETTQARGCGGYGGCGGASGSGSGSGFGRPSRRPASAPPAPVAGEAALEGFSADAWGVAASPRRLEVLRRQLAAVRGEVASLRSAMQEDAEACKELARLTEANRRRVRQLTEDEARAASATAEEAAEGTFASWDVTLGDSLESAAGLKQARGQRVEEPRSAKEEELAELYLQTESLAEEISVQAVQQIDRCKALRLLRTSARAARLRRSARVAVEARRRLGEECQAKAQELSDATEAAAALRQRALDLKQEVAAAGAEAAAASAKGLVQAVPEELMAALQSELYAEEQRTKLWQLIDAAQEEAQAALGRRSSELLADLTQAQAGARTVAGKLQDVECEEAQRARKLEEARRSAAAFAKEAQAFAAAHKSLEAELKVQRDATAAWQACATGLVSEQKGLSEEAARAASDCREALGWGSVGGPESRPVPGAAARAALQDWSSAPLLTARTSQGSGTHLCPPGGPSSSDPREGPGPECPDWQPDVPPDAPGGVWDSRGERSSSELLNSSFGGPERPAPDWHLRQEGPHQASVDFALAAARHAASELDLAVTEGGESEGSATSPTFSPLAMSALAFLAPL